MISINLSSRSDMSNVDPDEIQQDEIDVISSMYPDEFEPLTKEGVKPIRFRVTLAPLDDDSKNYVQASIDVVIPEAYPMRMPQISVRNVKGLNDSSVAKLTRTLHEKARARLGPDPIMHELLETANDFLVDLNVPRLSLIEKKRIREKERKEKGARTVTKERKESRDRRELVKMLKTIWGSSLMTQAAVWQGTKRENEPKRCGSVASLLAQMILTRLHMQHFQPNLA